MMTLVVLSLLVGLVLFSMMVGVIRAAAWSVRRIRRGEPLLPPAPERDVPWGFVSVVLVVVLYLVLNWGVLRAYINLTGGALTMPRDFELAEQMLLVSLVNVGVLLTVPALLRLTSGARLADIGFHRHNLVRQVADGARAFLVLSPLVYAFNILTVLIWKATPHKLEEMVRSDRSEDVAMLAIVSAVLLAPAAEELIFRCVLQGWLYEFFRRRWRKEWVDPIDLTPAANEVDPAASARDPEREFTEDPEFAPPSPKPAGSPDDLVGPSWFRVERAEMRAIAGSSALFAAVHLPQWPAPLSLFVLSLGLGLVYRRTGSLIAVIVMHAMFNGLGTLLLYWALQVGDMQAKNAKPPAGCVVWGSHLDAFSQRPETFGSR